MIFIWDAEAMQLHGVFRVDTAAPPLPSSEIPGDRPYQVIQDCAEVVTLFVSGFVDVVGQPAGLPCVCTNSTAACK